MQFFLLALFLLTSLGATTALADIYKSVDEKGQTTYSDQEGPDTKLMPTPSPNLIQMPKAEAPAAEQPEPEADSPYTLFGIVSPLNEATIRSNDGLGKIAMELMIEPALNTDKGHTINVLVDGEIMLQDNIELLFTLKNISRGSHIIHAEIIDQNNAFVIGSNTININVKNTSALHPSSKDGSTTRPGTVDAEGKPYVPGYIDSQGKPYRPGPVDADGNSYRPGPADPSFRPGPQGTYFRPGPVPSN